jgi:mRNA interferase MazF
MPRRYIPRRGDVVWLQFNPQTGHEQAGRRPAVVLSPESYNRAARLALFCPITSRTKGYPFETVVPSGFPVSGVILCDQIKSLDWEARSAEFICALAPEQLEEMLGKAITLLKPGRDSI